MYLRDIIILITILRMKQLVGDTRQFWWVHVRATAVGKNKTQGSAVRRGPHSHRAKCSVAFLAFRESSISVPVRTVDVIARDYCVRVDLVKFCCGFAINRAVQLGV